MLRVVSVEQVSFYIKCYDLTQNIYGKRGGFTMNVFLDSQRLYIEDSMLNAYHKKTSGMMAYYKLHIDCMCLYAYISRDHFLLPCIIDMALQNM